MNEKLYLKCDYCGEVFDEIDTANEHIEECDNNSFSIVPESEAF